MSRYCLDTSAYSHFKRGHAPVVELIDGADWIGVSTIVLGELWLGFGLGDRARQNVRELHQFLASPVVEVLSVDASIAQVFGEIAGGLRRKGTSIPTNDVWIAATAIRHESPILSYDRDFLRIERARATILSVPRIRS